MYRISYADVLEDDPHEVRVREQKALDHSIRLMERAEKAGPNSVEAVEAVTFLTKLWSMLIEDLASPENDLPKELRAHIISIGIWILKEAEKIRSGKSNSFSGLLAVSMAIAEGLK
ncbi:MAG: flagellar biosynthesis regulator FlhF [Alphaproteobacteria bacterium BRH_c36]|nr:MAG: flagellar biosynthesis regulator FlhF [Alphaproteobacteria bacterium BRH_c36]